ncbi:response regulator receiver domain-containing protein [Novosphingobium sp. PhB55]|uniref:response regulator n=1 Tax=Novosphingobium sp. PhB55 TaxID=2485106 RepID=UPI00106692B0|nr:response regulator [Novosphingobium sp. PhB55]TDW67372.1 response regulator receiver domain-containing protein [Novosphingobium sp. PhB55]
MSAELADIHVLVVEDEYLIAVELASALEDEGVAVIGPASSLAEGEQLRRAAGRIDGAILDINLRGESVFPLADTLQHDAVPFLFSTGCDAREIPDRFIDIPRCEKPTGSAEILREFTRNLRRRREAVTP